MMDNIFKPYLYQKVKVEPNQFCNIEGTASAFLYLQSFKTNFLKFPLEILEKKPNQELDSSGDSYRFSEAFHI